MLLSTSKALDNDFSRTSPTGHRRRPLSTITDGSGPSSSTLLPTTFSTPGKTNQFSLGSNPCSNFFLGGAFYPGKDKKRKQLKKKTLWYRLFCSSPWRKVLSLTVTAYLLFSSVIKPFSSLALDYGSFLVSSRRRKGLHGTWLLYDESLLPNIRTVEDERAEAMHLSEEQKRLQSAADKRQRTLERIVPGWYHRNDIDADKNQVVEEKLKEAERIMEQREGLDSKQEHGHGHRSTPKDHGDLQVERKSANQDPLEKADLREEKRRLANASSEASLSTRTIHNMHLFHNRSSCPSSLPSSEIRITLLMQSTPERLWILQRTCLRWRDPIVLVVFFNSEEAMASDEAAMIIGECPQLQLIRHLMDSNMGEDDRERYPVNRLRNIGLDSVQTSHVLMADVDFVPSNGLANLIRSSLVERNSWRSHPLDASISLPSEDRDAIVVPAFERIPPSELCDGPDCFQESQEDLMALSLPASFDELRACFSERKECRVFQSRNNWDGHSSTRSKTWLNGSWYEDKSNNPRSNNNATGTKGGSHNSSGHAARIRTLHCFDSVRYEPYVVLRWCPALREDSSVDKGPVAPYYDERFHGYGKNKIAMVSHLRIMGYSFSILPKGFIIHTPHSISKAKKAWESTKESSLHKNMDQLYPKFLKELVAKYQNEKPKIIKQC